MDYWIPEEESPMIFSSCQAWELASLESEATSCTWAQLPRRKGCSGYLVEKNPGKDFEATRACTSKWSISQNLCFSQPLCVAPMNSNWPHSLKHPLPSRFVYCDVGCGYIIFSMQYISICFMSFFSSFRMLQWLRGLEECEKMRKKNAPRNVEALRQSRGDGNWHSCPAESSRLGGSMGLV